MRALVIAEHDNQCLKPATLNCITAACQCADEVTLLVAGTHVDSVAEEAATIAGIKKVILVDKPQYEHFLAENVARLVVELANDFTHILAPATTLGKNYMPRVAALLDTSPVSDISSVLDPSTFVRPIYAGNAYMTVESNESIKVITVRPTAFDAASYKETPATIESLDADTEPFSQTRYIGAHLTVSERPELTTAKVVVSGGRALQSKENFAIIEQLADCLQGAVGASRAAVDAGYVPNDYQVGQTGKVVAPELYIAIGISGAIQHLAGMKDSKVIVAINKDAEAPIFQIADYGLVGDLFKIVPELVEKLSR